MQNLINELLQPRQLSDDTILQPSALMRRAANTLSQLNNMNVSNTAMIMQLQKELGLGEHLPQPDYMEILYEDYFNGGTTDSTS